MTPDRSATIIEPSGSRNRPFGDAPTGGLLQMVDITTSVSAIEGIGPVLEAKLHAIEVRTVFDLLRGTAAQIHAAVVGSASLEQVRAWREMAQLLQVKRMTPQWAEALHKGGVRNIAQLHAKEPAELALLFNDAQQNGIIPRAPDADAVFEMIVDAVQIHFTGMLVGSVINPDDEGIPDATLRIGAHSTVTDSRGRFRLIRIPLGSTQRLIIMKAGYLTATVDEAPVQRQEDLVLRETILLLPQSAAASAPARLDEFEGDVLPPLREHAMTTERRENAALREGDVFVIQKLYANDTDALLVSKFRAYENGTFIIYTWKVPRSDLPEHASPREHFRYRRGEFERFKLTSSRMRLLLQMRRMHQAFLGRPRPETLMEYDAIMAERAAFLRELEGA